MKALIFDVDGTLWDSTDVIADSWNEVLANETNWNLTIDGPLLKQHFGKPMLDISRAIFTQVQSEEELVSISQKCMDNQDRYLRKYKPALYDKVAETIKSLYEKYELYIVSNCHSGYIEALLDIYNLNDYIKDFTCPAYTNVLKAENIKIIMERNNINEVYYVGDTMGDLQACKAANVPFIFCRYGFGDVPQSDCAFIIDSFEELDNIRI